MNTFLQNFHTFPLGTKLQAMKLIGLCCQNPDSAAFYPCWPAFEHILCSERNEEILHLAACALFESISSHAHTRTFSRTLAINTSHNNSFENSILPQNNQIRATAAIENGLICPMPCIQFPAAVAAGKILYQQRQHVLEFWDEGLLARVATAADQAYRIQQGRQDFFINIKHLII